MTSRALRHGIFELAMMFRRPSAEKACWMAQHLRRRHFQRPHRLICRLRRRGSDGPSQQGSAPPGNGSQSVCSPTYLLRGFCDDSPGRTPAACRMASVPRQSMRSFDRFGGRRLYFSFLEPQNAVDGASASSGNFVRDGVQNMVSDAGLTTEVSPSEINDTKRANSAFYSA